MDNLDDWAFVCLEMIDDTGMSSKTALLLIFNLDRFRSSPVTETQLEKEVLSRLYIRELNKPSDNLLQ